MCLGYGYVRILTCEWRTGSLVGGRKRRRGEVAAAHPAAECLLFGSLCIREKYTSLSQSSAGRVAEGRGGTRNIPGGPDVGIVHLSRRSGALNLSSHKLCTNDNNLAHRARKARHRNRPEPTERRLELHTLNFAYWPN